MRVRRKHPVELEITAFLNLIVVLVPFLLSTAVFTRLAVLDLNLPAQSSSFNNLKGDLQLEIVIRPDALDVGDRIGGLLQKIPNIATGYDIATLSQLMKQVKEKFPDKTEATVLAQPDTSYEVLVKVMDTVREAQTVQGPQIIHTELFPQISVGDAPSTPGAVATNGKGS